MQKKKNLVAYFDKLYWTFPIGDTFSVPEKSGILIDPSFCWMTAMPSCLPKKNQRKKNLMNKSWRNQCFSKNEAFLHKPYHIQCPFLSAWPLLQDSCLRLWGWEPPDPTNSTGTSQQLERKDKNISKIPVYARATEDRAVLWRKIGKKEIKEDVQIQHYWNTMQWRRSIKRFISCFIERANSHCFTWNHMSPERSAGWAWAIST